MQTELFIEPKQGRTRLVIGGIYADKPFDINNPDDVKNTEYCICFGADQFYVIYDEIDHIESIVELACAHKMVLVEGYALSINKADKKWSIRNSGLKHLPNYVIASGSYIDGFEQSLNKFLKIFHK